MAVKHVIKDSIVFKSLLWLPTATHSSLLTWRIPWTEEPGGLQSGVWGGHKIAEHGWATECADRDEWSAEGSNIEMSSGFKKNFIYSFAVLGFVAAHASV